MPSGRGQTGGGGAVAAGGRVSRELGWPNLRVVRHPRTSYVEFASGTVQLEQMVRVENQVGPASLLPSTFSTSCKTSGCEGPLGSRRMSSHAWREALEGMLEVVVLNVQSIEIVCCPRTEFQKNSLLKSKSPFSSLNSGSLSSSLLPNQLVQTCPSLLQQ